MALTKTNPSTSFFGLTFRTFPHNKSVKPQSPSTSHPRSLSRLRRTVGLVARMGRPERRMVLQLPVHPEDDRERPQVDVEPPRREHLRDQTAVGQRHLVPDAVLPRAGRQQLLDCSESTRYPVLDPLVLAVLSDVDEHHEVLERLDAGRDHLADFSDLEVGFEGFIFW